MNISKFKEVSSGFFVLLIAFSYSIFFISQTALGLKAGEGSLFQVYSGLLAIVVFVMYLLSLKSIPGKASMAALLCCCTIVVLYYATQLQYGYLNKRYFAYFLSTGVRFIPAVLMGTIMLKDSKILEKIESALLPFVIFYTLALGQVVFTAKIGVNVGSTFNTEGGLSYQSISYYSIFAFGFTMYLISNGMHSNIKRKFLIALAITQVIMCIMSGGRGAFVLGVVFCVYFGLKAGSLRNLVKYLILVLFFIIIIHIVFADNAVFQQGFNRIFNFFGEEKAMENDNRWIRWGLAFDAFLDSPLWGHGLGSVFYEVGFYSHNIFTDLLCEGGIIFEGLFIFMLIRFYNISKRLIRIDSRYEILVIIFLCSFIMLCFSGYYLSESGMWIAMTYILFSKNKIHKYG